ncbi:MAG: DUF4296 domain-containing protein [Bacteroidales bacterium]
MKISKNVFLILLLLLIGCKKDKYVLPESKMENIIYDLYVGEALSDNQYGRYGNSDFKRDYYLTTLEKYGVTEAQYDSSLVFYGKHVDKYRDIYSRVVSRLEKEEAKYDRLLAQEQKAAKSLAGDSVNIWTNNRMFAILPTDDVQMIRVIPSDENFKEADSFTINIDIKNYPSDQLVEAPLFFMSIRHDDNSLKTNSVELTKTGTYEMTVKGLSGKKITKIDCYVLVNSQINGYFIPVIGEIKALLRVHEPQIKIDPKKGLEQNSRLE